MYFYLLDTITLRAESPSKIEGDFAHRVAGLDVATCEVANATGFDPLATNFSPLVASLAPKIF